MTLLYLYKYFLDFYYCPDAPLQEVLEIHEKVEKQMSCAKHENFSQPPLF